MAGGRHDRFHRRRGPEIGSRTKVKEGETLLTLEAMNMFAAISAPAAGTVQEISAKVGESVESKDLLIRMVK